jgi:hypothetical protein
LIIAALLPARENGLVRVVVTRIEHDGTMQRRVVDTVAQSDPLNWEDLITRALSLTPPYRPVPGTAIYHISSDDRIVQVCEYDLEGPLRDLVTVVLAMGNEPTGHDPGTSTLGLKRDRPCREGAIGTLPAHRHEQPGKTPPYSFGGMPVTGTSLWELPTGAA